MFVTYPRPVLTALKGSCLLTSLLALLQITPIRIAQASRYPTPAQSPSLSASAQTSPEVIGLESGKAVERELTDGQKHVYQITLAEGQYFRVEIKQLSIVVRVSLQRPDGKTIPLIDVRPMNQEVAFERVADPPGTYQITIHARTKAPTGRYEIRVTELRLATENDNALQQARTLFEEAMDLQRAGRFPEARPLMMRVLEIRERVLGPDHLEIANTLGFVGSGFAGEGDYVSAEPLYQRALKITEKVLGPDHFETANDFRQLGVLYYQKGDHLKAEEMFQRSLPIFERTHQLETVTVASVFAYLGDIYFGRGENEKAESQYQRSLAIEQKLLGPDHFHTLYAVTRLGKLAYDTGDYPKAEALFQRSLALAQKTFGQDHMQTIWILNNLATLYSTTGDYAKAEALFRQAQTIYERVGIRNEHAQNTLFGQARLSAAQGRGSEAIGFLSRAVEIEDQLAEPNLAVGSERQRLAYLAKLSSRSSRGISLHTELAPEDPAARDLAVTIILRRKGRVQDAMSQNLAALRLRSGAEEQKLFDELNGVTSKLASLVLGAPLRSNPAEHQAQIKKLEERREELEAEIGRRSSGFYHRAPPATLAAIQQAIPERAALIEFAAYRSFDPTKPDNETAYGELHYVAYVLRSQREVQWKELGPAKEIDEAISVLRQALPNPMRKDALPLARAVDERVMQPIRPLLGDATQLLVSPDGALNLIPFEALIDEQGNYLVQRYSFTYLTSGRDLLRMSVARASKSKPTVVANPSFGEPNQTAATTIARKSARIDSKRRSVTAANHLSQIYFAALGGSAQEARTIQVLFPETTLLTGAAATETAIKQVVAPRILHVATHGFFLEDPGNNGPSKAPLASRGSTSAKIENPLLRSGLALTGANLRVSGVSDDGILTALEASGLNLWGTKLVVLSACDTGLGEVRNDEGVYGLRRAFVQAGAESLVMSLWPVSDYSTRNLMINYYRNLRLGLGRGAALRQVQLDLLKRNRQLHPFYWANFIQSGEWANLDGKR